MAPGLAWQRYVRISTETAFNTASPEAKADWNIGGNGGGAHGWMDFPVLVDNDNLQPKNQKIFPQTQSGTRNRNAAAPVAAAYDPALGSYNVPVYPEMFDRILYHIMGGVARIETAGAAALAATAFATLVAGAVDLTTQSNGTEQLKFTVAGADDATAAVIQIKRGAAVLETITIGTKATSPNGVYYSKGAYNGTGDGMALSILATGAMGGTPTVAVAGVDYVTSTFSQANTNPFLVLEEGGRKEAGAGNSEYYPGMIVPQCQLSWDRATIDSILMAQLTVQGLYGGATTKTTFANDAAAYYRPLMAWNCAASIDGVPTTEIVSVNLNINNNNEMYAVQSGSQNPSGGLAGEIEIFGDMVCLPGDDTLWAAYQASTEKKLGFNFLTPHYVVDTTAYQLQITMSSIYLEDYTRNRQNAGQGATIPFRGVYNATDVGALKIVKRDRMPV